MVAYGINTVRIPVGYWMMESIVYSDSEHFPQGGIDYLKKVCGYASDRGLYIIIDLHGAPGAQVEENADTGQYAPTPGFFVSYQYDRALQFLAWMTNLIHTTNSMRNVGMLEIVNEPVRNSTYYPTMISSYYPNALTKIRAAESAIGTNSTGNNALHMQMMAKEWGAGNPIADLASTTFTSFDSHRYIKWDTSVTVDQTAYITAACNYGGSVDAPTIVGEFSLSVPDSVQDTAAWATTSANAAFYEKFFAAQAIGYEANSEGWIFWSWKAQLSDYRWSYKDAVAAGIIPTNLDSIYTSGAC
ncbi:hypothetical protein HK405_015385 [Cladochytrium tenue]|nr:hypothetical protein HK405_015385 [Cladochytrium tenue]